MTAPEAPLKVTPMAIPEVLLVEPRVIRDERGYFIECYSRRTWRAATGLDVEFVQDNQSRSRRGVLRGLHYQLPPHAQGKLVRVLAGEVFDVAVDLRRSSPTFGQWVGARLTADSPQMWVPPGFAHGYLALSEWAEVLYKVTAFHAPEVERSIRWDDPEIGVEWPLGEGERPVVSVRDQTAVAFGDAEAFA